MLARRRQARPWQSPIQKETPLAERVFGMRIRRSEETFHPDPWINLFDEADKLPSMHLFADVFIQTPSKSGFLNRTGWNTDNDLRFFFLNFVTDQDVPREKLQSLNETF